MALLKKYTVSVLFFKFLLFQDVSSEQALSHQLTAEVERLNRKLQRAEDELKARTDSLKQSEEKVEKISRRLQNCQSLLVSLSPDSPRQDESPEPETGASSCHTAGELERELRERVTELEKEVCVENVVPGLLDSYQLD